MLHALQKTLAALAVLMVVDTTAHAQSAQPVASHVKVIQAENYIHTVVDLDKSFAFYRDVIGFEVLRAPGAGISNAVLQRLTNTAGAQFRSAAFKIQGTDAGLLLTEFNNITRTPSQPKNADPGASTMVLTFRDLDKVLAAATQAHAPVVTRGSKPISMRPGMRAIFIKDPDGFFIELSQIDPTPASSASANSNVVTARIAFTVADSAPVLSFYRDVLGFEVKPPAAFTVNKAVNELVDAPGMEFRSSYAKVPGTALDWEFVEFKGVAQRAYRGNVQDPGTAAASLVVSDVRAALAAAKTAGASIVSASGEAVMGDKGGGSVFIRDPGGILLELMQKP